MAQLANLVLTDRTTPTPVAHTFTPRDIVGNVATLVESSGVPLGDNRVTLTMKRTPSGRYKPSLQFTFPVIANEIVNGVARPTVARVAYADITFSFDAASTEAERANAVGQVEWALKAATALVNSTLVKLEGVY
jgi:hypothetical protein